MPMNRFMALPFVASLIPDHPRAAEWLDLSAEYLRFKLAMNTAPGGAWRELISYFMASVPHVMQAALTFDRSGRLDHLTARQVVMPATFALSLMSPPDPRFGVRTVPGWGHEGHLMVNHWLLAAGLMRDRDPQLARDFAWAWDRNGQPMNDHHDAGFSPSLLLHADLLADVDDDHVPAALRSTWFPGFGAVMRAHVGHPNEVYLSYRQGYLVSHTDANQGDFILYANGAPLSPLSLFGYSLHANRPPAQLSEAFVRHATQPGAQPVRGLLQA
ncbi:MAG: hypothetical protein WD534_08620 [Phycisphaeraceae bacterium]